MNPDTCPYSELVENVRKAQKYLEQIPILVEKYQQYVSTITQSNPGTFGTFSYTDAKGQGQEVQFSNMELCKIQFGSKQSLVEDPPKSESDFFFVKLFGDTNVSSFYEKRLFRHVCMFAVDNEVDFNSYMDETFRPGNVVIFACLHNHIHDAMVENNKRPKALNMKTVCENVIERNLGMIFDLAKENPEAYFFYATPLNRTTPTYFPQLLPIIRSKVKAMLVDIRKTHKNVYLIRHFTHFDKLVDGIHMTKSDGLLYLHFLVDNATRIRNSALKLFGNPMADKRSYELECDDAQPKKKRTSTATNDDLRIRREPPLDNFLDEEPRFEVQILEDGEEVD